MWNFKSWKWYITFATSSSRTSVLGTQACFAVISNCIIITQRPKISSRHFCCKHFWIVLGSDGTICKSKWSCILWNYDASHGLECDEYRPGVRWRGGWRFYGSEDVLLDRCCLSAERIRRVGVNMEEFRLLGRCHGLNVQMKRPQSNDGDDQDNSETFTVESFRDDIRNEYIIT